MATDIVEITRGYSTLIENGRTLRSISAHMATEVAELDDEIAILDDPNRSPGADGVIGEAIDVILCALDIIFVHRPEITDKEIADIAIRKCEKWAERYRHSPVRKPNMVEFGRAAQITALRRKGWVSDDLCQRLNYADGESIGGPEFMLAPDGLYYACSCGVETPLHGVFKVWKGQTPPTLDDIQRSADDPEAIERVVFTGGRR